jgi:hypothetical protein
LIELFIVECQKDEIKLCDKNISDLARWSEMNKTDIYNTTTKENYHHYSLNGDKDFLIEYDPVKCGNKPKDIEDA